MKKIFSFTKKKKHQSGTPDSGSVLSAGYDLKEKDLGKVHKAALSGDLAKLKQLAKKNDINQLDKENRTPLHIACANGHAEVVQFLVDSKAKLNLCDNQNRSALMKAVQGQHERCVSILLENHAEPNLVDINGNTALHLAANIPSISTAVLLLQHGAEINAQNKEGFTPLTVAVREDHMEMTEFLLKESADVNSLDQDQRSPLMLAAGNEQINMVKLLLQFDADVTLKDTKGWSADDYAAINGHHLCSHLIIEHSTQKTNVSRQGPSKKKKMLGSPSHDVEAGFSLGGPAIDKDEHGANEAGGDLEDNSQSESVSRVSKSAADEWPSSEDEDESVLNEKKPLQVNITRMFGSTKGEGDSSAGSEEGKHSEGNKRIDSQEESSAGEDSEEEEDNEEGEDDNDDDDDDNEEEEEEDEGNEDEESDAEEENEEEDESEEEEDASCDFEDAQKSSIADVPKISLSADTQKAGTSLRGEHEKDGTSEENAKSEPENTDLGCPAVTANAATPATLDVVEDCVVSAIRVESTFSDDEESLAKECLTSNQKIISNQGSTEVPMPLVHQSPREVKEEEFERETEKDHGHSWSDNEDIDAKVWSDSDDDVKNKTGGSGHSTLIAFQRHLVAKVGSENTDSLSDADDVAGSNRKQEEKHRSSWGSSLEGSGTDVPKESENNRNVSKQESGFQTQHSKDAVLPNDEQPDSSWDSSLPVASPTKCVSPRLVLNEERSCTDSVTGCPQPKTKPSVEESERDDRHDRHDIGSTTKCEAMSSDLKSSIAPETMTKQEQEGSWEEEDKESVEKESNDPSPVVSTGPEDDDDNDHAESVAQSSQMEGKSDSENDKEGNSWDDEDESVESEKQRKREATPLSRGNLPSLSSRPKVAVAKKAEKAKADNIESDGDNEVIPHSIIDEKSNDDKLVVPKRCSLSKDDEWSEDSDSTHQKLQYDFASATAGTLSEREDSGNLTDRRLRVDGDDARLTSYVPLENKIPVGTKTRESCEGQISTYARSSPPPKDDDALSDEALPQTDIDDVDVNPPDEAERTDMKWPELRDSEDPQKDDSAEDEDEDGGEEGQVEEEEEGDMSDENNQSEGSGGSPEATSPVPEAGVVKEKKRDFLSELGLEGGEEEPESWDSESNSENANTPHKENQDFHSRDQREMSSTEAPLEEHMFYIPSFLRGRGGSRMAEIGRPQSSQREAGSNGKDENGGEPAGKADTPQKENEKANWERLNVLSKLEGKVDQRDLMEELSLGDVDDLEDASDWDSASTTSKRTLPGRRMASPGIEEFPEDSKVSGNEQEGDAAPAAPSTPQKSSSSDKLPSAPSKSAPQPQPCPRKMGLQEEESKEVDWETDKVASPCQTSPDDNQQRNLAEPPAVVEPGSPELSLMAKDTNGSMEFNEQQQEEKDDAVYRRELDLFNSGSEGNTDFRSQGRPEDTHDGDAPWEKRYEKLWVEVEKREVKSTFKNVAGELKEKFGELFQSRRPAESATEDEATSAEEDSSDEEEEEGEVIVRPAARARSTVLLPIPEQRESGQEDSAAESPDDSLCEERMQPSRDRSIHRDSDLLSADAPRSASPQLDEPLPESEKGINHDTETSFDDDGVPVRSDYRGSLLKDETKQAVVPVFRGTPGDLSEADVNNVGSGDELEDFPVSQLSQQSRWPDVSEELEEDRKRFKLEVGNEEANTAMRGQKSSSLLDGGGTSVEDVGSKRAETGSGYLSNQPAGIHQEEQPVAAQRAPALSHLPVQQSCNSKKQEKPQVVRGARPSRAPQTNTHVNGDPLSVFDDSSLSDVSDDEERFTTPELQKSKNPEEMDVAEDFDELTQSSDTATDDTDSPTSGYRHASLLIQKLDSATLDTTSVAKLQNIFHEYERSIQKERSRRGYLADKVRQLEMERTELKNSLEEVKDAKSLLERNQLELQTEITNLKFQLKQEQENRHNANMMYNTTRDKLRRTEEQHQLEVQERQKVELTLRNLELEMRTLICNMKQLEEDHSETQRLLAQERSTRVLQENLLSNHLRKQQEMEAENKRNMSKSNEALSQLTEASEREKELLHQLAASQEQQTMLRADLERLQANSGLKESQLAEENEVLKEQLEDVRRDLKLSEDTVTQTVFSCNNQLSALKSELAKTTSRLESERQLREALEMELESTRSRLVGAVKEAELRLAAHSDTEKALLREKEEHQWLKDRHTGEVASQREAVSSLSQKLAKAEARANSKENEVHRVTLQLTEKGLLLDVLQREKDQAAARVKEMEAALQEERESASRASARQEAAQERLAHAQSEAMLLQQQLEEAQNKGVAKERAVTDAQERFSDILSKLRSDSEERVQLIEDRNKELASKAADLRDQIYKLEEEKNERETSLRQLQQELADSLKKLSMSEASLEVNTRYRNDLEEEKTRLLKDLDRIKGKLEESEDQHVQAERHMIALKSSLEEREKELGAAAQKLQEALSASAASETTVRQLEEAVQKLEIENARLEAAAKQQSSKIDALQKGAQEAAMLTGRSPGGGVRGHLEEVVTNLQSSKMTLEEQLNREVQKQSMLSHTAQDSQALWEEELKSRSKLGLRLAELEKEKGELTAQMEVEKKKAKKITEQKKAIDTRLDQEMKRNSELQKEMYRLRTLLKTAKKKLRDQEAGGAEFASPMSSLRMDQGRHRHSQADDLQEQLEKETYRRSQLERTNEELKVQIASMKSLGHNSDHYERSKRQLEEEVLGLRRRLEAAQVEQSQVDQYRREAEEKARQEIQQKLEQVNLFLQSQAASQEALDQIKAANEASLRSQLEQKIRELEGDLGRARTTQQDSLNQRESTRTELERYQQLYTEEMRLRKSLTAKLERANSRLAEANSKLLSERSRSLITSNITNGSLVGPPLDLSSLGSPGNYGATLGPLNRSFGLGLSLLSPAAEGQNSRVEDYLAKMQRELDRNISKELSSAAAELDAASVRMSPVGSASRAELDPVSRATQQYLEVLKKNNRL
ncbi:uncharacterized protein si:ch211-272n13.3 isoform X3 [Kryptolebias marmoratus]|uniref:uncharacterized protein si:ch211-272n13.3 isoform X3 n=1 Tax=Kryptolebias marmoratus TaxID=37003 RepID=UPI000D52FD8D|nr:uncharacterized protein si:ch211-272n13.3 isoform X3 [Kryptolebias marmoratus]